MRYASLVDAAALAFSAMVASPLSIASDAYKVSATLSHAGKPFATPTATVLAGHPARVGVSGTNGYTLSLTVTQLAADRIQVAAGVDSAYGTMQPTVVVHPDQPTTVSAGDLRLEVTVSPSDG